MRHFLLAASVVALVGLAVEPAALARLLLGAGMPGLAARVSDDPAWRGTALYAAGRYAEAAQAFSKSPYNRGNALARAGELKGALAAYEAALARDPSDEDAKANRELVARLLDTPDAPGGRTAGQANAKADAATRYATKTESDANDPGTASTGDGLAGHRESSSAADSPGNSKAARTGRAEQRAVDPGRGQARGSASDAEGGGRRGGGNASVSEVVEREVRRVSKSFEAREIRPDRHWLATLTDDPGRFVSLRVLAEQTRRREAGTAVQPGSNPW
ncbi:tetratricopeptide repeat protein [Methylobacterium sp. SyP6R]|uniref:tetratricopeptide repeat protein n=1 Tax=Methylobacterium sp. SyP6R TaxID=2718876 RepID=UPI001F1E8BA4|nr:tetratricopeptide repeat protein [Methylobacterium sp. SyP6R]MCF4124033.1 tetratricopeptide repeat protein [Methylobacterium sp. SyP6R]